MNIEHKSKKKQCQENSVQINTYGQKIKKAYLEGAM